MGGLLQRPEQRPSHGTCRTQRTRGPGAKIEVTGLGDYTRNIGYMNGSMAYECETKQLLKYELKIGDYRSDQVT